MRRFGTLVARRRYECRRRFAIPTGACTAAASAPHGWGRTAEGQKPGRLEFDVMRTPSIVPDRAEQTVYLMADDLGRPGLIRAESDLEHTEIETVIMDMLQGEYKSPLRVIAFNTAEHWSEDISQEVARELRLRCDLQQRDVPFFLQAFVDRYEGRRQEIQSPLPIRIGP
jgi:hypothetical protein